MGFQNPVVGGTALRIPAIQSPNYQAGVAGWIIKIDGSAEFNNLTVRGQFSGTDFIINSSGTFLYSGTPASGNLIGSWTSASGTDAFGNSYQAGLTLYSASGTINLFGTVATWKATPSNSRIDIQVGGGSVLQEYIPADVGGVTWNPGSSGATLASRLGTNTPETFLQSPNNTANPGQAAQLQLYGAPQTSNGDVLSEAIVIAARMWADVTTGWITGAWAKLSETWQTPSVGTGWATGPSGGTVQAVQYRRDAEDNLIIVGAVHSTSTTPAATIFNLPAGYRPKITQRSPGVSNSAGTATARFAEVNSNGNVSINANLTTTSTDVYFQVCVPLGNIS